MDISGWFGGLFGQVGEFFGKCGEAILKILPDSPFVMLEQIPEVKEWMPYVNYFVPFDFAVATLSAWLVAVTGFYLWSILLRWIKAIE